MGGFFKHFKKYMLPGIGGKLLGAHIFKDKKKPGEVDTTETPAQMEAHLQKEQEAFGNIDTDAMNAATDNAKAAGTYSDSSAFKTALQAEAGAAARTNKFTSLQRQNAILAKLGRPQLPVGTTPAMPGTTTPGVAPPGTTPPQPVVKPYDPNSNQGVIAQ